MKRSKGEQIFQVADIIILTLMTLSIIFPVMHVFSMSISSREAVLSLSVGILPKGINFLAYKEIIVSKVFLRSFFNTVILSLVYTILSVLANVMGAYGFTKNFYGKKFITNMFVVSMYFSGGLIPTYILITKYLNLYNNYLAIILPGLGSFFTMIVIRSQIETIPGGLREAAIIDGAREYQVLFYIIIPAIAGTIAAMSMFAFLGMWNSWFGIMLYTNKESMWTLQYYLRAVIFEKFLEYQPQAIKASREIGVTQTEKVTPLNFQMAAIILVALPVISIYPFIQKYFVKGIMVGGVKG